MKIIARVVFLLLTLLAIHNNVFSQKDDFKIRDSIVVTSLEGEVIKVNILLDPFNRQIVLSLPTLEQMCLNSWHGLETIKVLNKNFIILKHRSGGGTNVREVKTLVVCISNHKFYQALDLVSYRSYDFEMTYNRLKDSLDPIKEIGQYELSILSLNDDKKVFSLTAKEYEKIESKEFPDKNLEASDTIRLKFDEKRKVFYTEFKNIQGVYELDNKEKKVIKNEKYPVVKLQDFGQYWAGSDLYSDQEYYFVDNHWYGHNRKMPNHLSDVSPPCYK